MKITIIRHACDVCGRREDYSGDRPRDWQEISYKETWRDGCHAGNTEKKFLACEACLKEDSKKLFSKLLGIFKAQ